VADGTEALWHAYWRRFTEGQALKKAGRSQEALDAFLLAVDATERHAAHDAGGVAPAPYHEAAILFRRLGDLDGELALLERFACQQHANGVIVPRLLERLEKMRVRAGVTASPPAPNPAPGTTGQPDDPFRARRFRSPPPPPNPQQLVHLLPWRKGPGRRRLGAADPVIWTDSHRGPARRSRKVTLCSRHGTGRHCPVLQSVPSASCMHSRTA
jgi:hypothetical protein